MTLVIVDDDDGARSALGRLLRCMGHAVREFDSAEAFEAEPVAADCLIVDVRLPGLSGPELRDRLRGREHAAPVVFITGDPDHKTREMVHAPTAIVAKPFDDETLMAAINAAISAAARPTEHHAG
jgi:FixJ family two-component response regulator